MKLQKRVYELLDVGTYGATVQSVEQATGQYGDQAKMTFGLDDSDAVLTAWASAKYGPNTKLGRWASAILGGMADELDTDMLIGKPCRLVVTVKAKDDGTQYNKVDEVLPPKRRPKPEEAKPARAGDVQSQAAKTKEPEPVIPTPEEAPLPF